MLSPPLSPFPQEDQGHSTANSEVQRKLPAVPSNANSSLAEVVFGGMPATSTPSISSDDDSSSSTPATVSAPSSTNESVAAAGRKRASMPPSPSHHSMTTCWDSLVSNPAKYLRRERSFLELYPMRRHSWASPGGYDGPSGSGNASGPSSGLGSDFRSRGGRRAYARGSVTGMPRARRFGSEESGSFYRRAHSTGAVSSGDRVASDSESDETRSPRKSSPGAASPAEKRRSTTDGGVRVHDLSLHQIADYSPPLSTLPPGKSLRAEWKGAPMDLSKDPDVHLLHAAEVHLASVLRLPAEVYLDSKRRLFAEKVHRLRQGLPFRRTDSQKACRIDVNKASRLFSAFEKVGWLDDELFERFLV